jgi:hypothetical protein
MLAVLGLGALALIADRMFSGPTEAQALDDASTLHAPAGPAAASGAPAAASAQGSAPQAAPSRATLLRRMQELPEAADFEQASRRDAFKPPAEWLPVVEEVQAQTPRDTRVDDFVRTHRLRAVMSGPGGGFAVVSGRPIQLGYELDGFTLVRIGARSVTFKSDDAEVVLSLPERAGEGSN